MPSDWHDNCNIYTATPQNVATTPKATTRPKSLNNKNKQANNNKNKKISSTPLRAA
jgi:hypothetical protein